MSRRRLDRKAGSGSTPGSAGCELHCVGKVTELLRQPDLLKIDCAKSVCAGSEAGKRAVTNYASGTFAKRSIGIAIMNCAQTESLIGICKNE